DRRSGDRASEDVDALTFGDADDRSLRVGARAVALAGTATLARPVERVDVGHRDVEDLLDRDLDLGLVGVAVDQERVLVAVEQRVRLLAHDRGQQHVAVVLVELAHFASSCGSASASSVASSAGVSASAASSVVVASSAAVTTSSASASSASAAASSTTS